MLDELSLHELDIILIVFRRCDVRLPVGIWESRLFDILITMPTETAVQSEASNLILYSWLIKQENKIEVSCPTSSEQNSVKHSCTSVNYCPLILLHIIHSG